MIEQAMYFALGFLVAGLLMLMFLPAFWRRATRLSVRRLQMLVPLSMEEVAAERDLLRAEFAMGYRRLEQQMEAVKASKAQDMANIGLSAARIAELDAQLTAANARVGELEQRLGKTQKILEEKTALLGSTEAALHEMTDRAERGVASQRTRWFGRPADVDAALSEAKGKLETTLTENGKLKGVLEETRARLRVLEKHHAKDEPIEALFRLAAVGGSESANQSGDRDILALRQAIVDMGARMAEIAASSANTSEAPQSKRAL